MEMKVKSRYLVSKMNQLVEWECLEVSDFAYKVKTLLDKGVTTWAMPGITQPGDEFWILKTDILDRDEKVEEVPKNNNNTQFELNPPIPQKIQYRLIEELK